MDPVEEVEEVEAEEGRGREYGLGRFARVSQPGGDYESENGSSHKSVGYQVKRSDVNPFDLHHTGHPAADGLASMRDLYNLIADDTGSRPEDIVTTPRVARCYQLMRLWDEAKIRGWRDNWQKARMYRRMLVAHTREVVMELKEWG